MKLDFSNNLPDRAFISLQAKSGAKYENLRPNDPDSLKKAAQGFETIFITYLLRTMRQSVPESSLFGPGLAGDFYKSLFDEKIAEAVASKNGIGLADIIIENLQRDKKEQTQISGKNLSDYRKSFVNLSLPQEGNKNWDRSIIREAANYHGVDAKLVEAVIRVESDFRADAISPKGAVGLMQLMESTAAEMGVKDRKNPRENIFGGVKYLRNLLNRFNGNLEFALAAYNAGPAAVEKYNGIPPYAETQRYVEKVLRAYRES
jgi:soluble lytic murein transglycosylase-like protein